MKLEIDGTTVLRQHESHEMPLNIGIPGRPDFNLTHFSLLTGGNAVLDEYWTYQSVNDLKNHWRGAAAPADIVAGMVWSKNSDDYLYHYDGSNHLRVIQHDSSGYVYIDSADGSDSILFYHDNTDAYCKWDDGNLIFQTDEGTNTSTVLHLKPKGSSEISEIGLFDTDGQRLQVVTVADRIYMRSMGGSFGINDDAAQDVLMFESASSGETKELKIYGYRAADALRSLQIGVGVDAADTASFDGLSNYYFGGNVGIGTTTIPHGGVGSAKFAIDGTASSATAGPWVQFTVSTNDYPILQIAPWTHDDMEILFDSYYSTDSLAKSSDAGSNFAIIKASDSFQIRYDSGVAAGNNITWNAALVLDISGNVTLSTTAASLILPINNDAVTPTIAFGDGDTGFYESADDNLAIATSSVARWGINSTYIWGTNTSSGVLRNTTSTSTLPVHTFFGDEDTGIGRADADQLSLIAGGVEGMRLIESTTVSIGIGTTTAPAGGVGIAKVAIDGTSSSTAGPHMQFTITGTVRPKLGIYPWTSDNIHMTFDSYFDGSTWRSSDAGSNFKFMKYTDYFYLDYDSGIAAGNAITWNTGIRLDTSGIVAMPAVYSHDMNGETIRDLQINNSGELGYDSSTKRAKTNIIDMENTSWIYDLRPVNYNPKANTKMKRWGLIAEEVFDIMPEFTFLNHEGLIEGINKKEFIFPILNEVQRHEIRIAELEAEVKELRSQLN